MCAHTARRPAWVGTTHGSSSTVQRLAQPIDISAASPRLSGLGNVTVCVDRGHRGRRRRRS
jgi:hypothetical protein